MAAPQPGTEGWLARPPLDWPALLPAYRASPPPLPRELAAAVDSPQGYASLAGMLEARQAVVLPAFEPRDQSEAEGGALAMRAVAGDKAFVAGEYE